MATPPTTYWDYIRVEDLLALQSGLPGTDVDNDEVMFITVHQIDELWFKLVLRELQSVRDLFKSVPVPEQRLAAAVRGIRRVGLLFGNAAQHFSLMETMTTRDYLSFRDRLMPASGFQSAQMREIEILLGLDGSQRIPLGHENSYLHALRNADGSESPASRRVDARLRDLPTLKDALDEWLYRTPIQGSGPQRADDAEVVQRFVGSYVDAYCREARGTRDRAKELATTEADARRLEARYDAEVDQVRSFLEAADEPEASRARRSRIRAALVFLESYRELPLLAWPREVLDALVAMEQASIIFRQRHARMVERVIGRRTGTGGSAGVEYLDRTALAYRVFHDMWAVRTLLIRAEALPPLADPAFYGFVGPA
jgi:tryptophan 2,3-dioxygenase